MREDLQKGSAKVEAKGLQWKEVQQQKRDSTVPLVKAEERVKRNQEKGLHLFGIQIDDEKEK